MDPRLQGEVKRFEKNYGRRFELVLWRFPEVSLVEGFGNWRKLAVEVFRSEFG